MACSATSPGLLRILARAAAILMLGTSAAWPASAEKPLPAMALGGGSPAGMISTQAVDRFSTLLRFKPSQREAAASLHEGYVNSSRAALRSHRSAVSRVLESQPPDRERSRAVKDQLASLWTAHRTELEGLDAAFMADLSALSTPAQMAAWPAVERARRREQLLRGIISGESIDLLALVESLKLPAADTAALAAPLSAYELDLDRLLVDKARVLKEEDPFRETGGMSSSDAMARTTRARVIGLSIRDLNDNVVRVLAMTLPSKRAEELRSAYLRAAFPTVFEARYGAILLELALKSIPNLADEPRAAIAAAQTRYKRDVDAANAALITAIRDAETAQRSVTMPTGETSVAVHVGAPDTNFVMLARNARAKLDAGVMTFLEKTLTPEQFESLPPAKSLGPREMILRDDGSFMVMRQ